MANRTDVSAAVLEMARKSIAKHFPGTTTAEQARMAWLLFCTDAGRAELRLRARSLTFGKTIADPDARDSIAEMSVDELMSLQTLMAQKAAVERMIANILRSNSETAAGVISNLKA